MPFKKAVNSFYQFFTDSLFIPAHVFNNKFLVFIKLNGTKGYECYTLIKRPGRRKKDVLHHLTLAPGKNKRGIRALLNMGSQYSLYIFFWIFSDLLKFIDSNYARLISSF